MIIAQQARQQLRALIEGEECLFPASVYDPISVRIAGELGYELGMFGGSVASLTVLGAPDEILLTLSELVDQARRMTRAGSLPIICDADHGYGNSLNVMRTVEELENAGIAGLSIEDTELPRQFGNADGKRLLSVEEGVGKIKAAISARQDGSLVIVGRTDAASITNIEDVIEWLTAYEEAGADVLFAVGIKTGKQLEALSAETRAPLMLGGVPAELMDRGELAKGRVRICLQGHQPFAAAVQAVYDTLNALRQGTLPADLAGVANKEMMSRLMESHAHRQNVDAFLK
ncbi:MAG: oxaloacetate decarboxylase [Rhizobiaceae bacterium]|nr:oxaloacetate decarboxylase [Rhizobiaceae bacterium]